MQTNYENALSFIESYGWNDEKLREAENIIPLIATMLELYSSPKLRTKSLIYEYS